MEEKLGKQDFHYDTEDFFEPITKAVTDISEKLLEESKSTTKAVEGLNESNVNVKASEFMNENGVIDTSLIKPLATFLVGQNNSQFRLYNEPVCDNWNYYILNGKKLQYMTIS